MSCADIEKMLVPSVILSETASIHWDYIPISKNLNQMIILLT